MDTKQPVWRNVGHIGDVDPIAYGGGFVYEDETGIYCPEMSYFEPAPDSEWHKTEGATPLRVYRVLLEKDSTREWWYEDLQAVANYTGQTLHEAQRMANGTTMERAILYSDLISYHGAENFDSYPQTMTEDEAYARYKAEMKASRY